MSYTFFPEKLVKKNLNRGIPTDNFSAHCTNDEYGRMMDVANVLLG